MNGNIRQEIEDLLRKEENILSRNIPKQGMGLLEIIRSLDYFWAYRQSHELDLHFVKGFISGANKALGITLADAKKMVLFF